MNPGNRFPDIPERRTALAGPRPKITVSGMRRRSFGRRLASASPFRGDRLVLASSIRGFPRKRVERGVSPDPPKFQVIKQDWIGGIDYINYLWGA